MRTTASPPDADASSFAAPTTSTVAATRYAAIAARDASQVGLWFYAVKTTGVYCKPSCGARLANRENVSFHDTVADAERAGFRACKRCRPDRQDHRHGRRDGT